MDEVSCVEANDVDAQDLSCVLAVHHLCQTLALLLCQSLCQAPCESFDLKTSLGPPNLLPS